MDSVFKPSQISSYHREIRTLFSSYFEGQGYKNQVPAPIVSLGDHSVRFTGSTSNVFKPYFVDSSRLIPDGLFLIQRCLRTQNAKFFFDDTTIPEWGSYFTEVGAIAPVENLGRLITDSLRYFVRILGMEKERIVLRVSSRDNDLLECVNETGFLVEVDGLPMKYYRHNYGLEMVSGRNFNLGVRNSQTAIVKDIGNIVVVEDSRRQIAVEMGFGISTLLARHYDLVNSIQASTISSVIPFQPGLKSKLSDVLSSIAVMLREKIRPSGRDKGRILRTYIEGLVYLAAKTKLSLEGILDYAAEYEELEFGSTSSLPDDLMSFLQVGQSEGGSS
jgi:hypothetical protein